MGMNASCDNSFKIEDCPFTSIYEVSSEIGRGKFAVVKRCRHKHTSDEFAAKFIRKRRKGVDCRKDVLHEINMLQATISHPHFVNLVEVYESAHEMILVTELMRGGELFQYITTEGQIDEACTISLMRQIINGLVFLHSQNIVHLDIKPQNILLTKSLPDCHIKLCDLGLARVVNEGEDIFEIIGTPDYVAPEILDYQKLNAACDMWSVGVLAYVMLSGCSPFAGDNNQETFLNISQVNLDFPDDLFRSTSSEAIDFIKKLLLKEPESRLTAEECLNHPWLKSQVPPSPFINYELRELTFNHEGPAGINHELHQVQMIQNCSEIISDDESPTKFSLVEARITQKSAQALHELQNINLLPPSSPKRIWTGSSCENWEPSGIPA